MHIKTVEDGINAINVIRDRLTLDLAVGKKSFVAQVVCADPKRVDSIIWLAGEEFTSICIGYSLVREKSWDFVTLDIWEESHNIVVPSWCDIVGTDCASHGVVVEIGSRIP